MSATHNPYAVFEDRATCPLCPSEGKPKQPKSGGLPGGQDERQALELSQQQGNSTNVYVSNLLPDLDEHWMRKEFSRFGLITSAKIMMKNGVSKGYGFVQYTEPEMAQAAVLALHGSYVGDNCLSCKLADRDKDRGAQNQPSNNLYIGNLPTNWGVVEVSELFGSYGPISSLVVLSDPVTGGSRGVSLVRYHTVDDATKCIEALDGIVMEGHDRPLEVKYAETTTEKHFRKCGKKRNPAPKKAVNPRGRGKAAGEPQLSAEHLRSNKSLTSVAENPWSSSNSNSSASNGTLEVNSPEVGSPNSFPNGPCAPARGFSLEDNFAAFRIASSFAMPPAIQPNPIPAARGPIHIPAFLLRPPTALSVRTSPPAQCQPPLINPGYANISVGPPNTSKLMFQQKSESGRRAQPPGPSGAVLKVTGLPRSFDEITLYKVFTPFGAIESVSVPAADGAGPAFIRFRAARDACAAVGHLQGSVVQDHVLAVELQ